MRGAGLGGPAAGIRTPDHPVSAPPGPLSYWPARPHPTPLLGVLGARGAWSPTYSRALCR
ncbi:hypothetical protein PYJP_19440 [Pyrofollis japonicus]|nr:hypothetical protein PYJP_19440 [Pyrofollis japonicus]